MSATARHPERNRSDLLFPIGAYAVVSLLMNLLLGADPPEGLEVLVERDDLWNHLAVMVSGMLVVYYQGTFGDPWKPGKVGVYALLAALILFPLGRELTTSGSLQCVAVLGVPMAAVAALTYVSLKLKDYLTGSRAR